MKKKGPVKQSVLALAILLAAYSALPAQDRHTEAAKSPPPANRATANSLDPAAMQALKTMSTQLRGTNTFSFTANVMREEPGTNGQMLDFFRCIKVQEQRPNKLRLEVQGSSDVNLWYDGKSVTLMPASGNIYTTLSAPPDLDATLTMLHDKIHTHMPLVPFLRSDPNAVLSDGIQTANEVGVVPVGNEQLLHLAFTEPDADWQLWLTGPNQVLPRRMAIVYKNIEGQPRVSIDFSNWKLDAEVPSSAFVFSKPVDARAAAWNTLQPRTLQQGEKTK